ncbi:hypothetical protein N7513_003220 [Penicillium frequentans]|nr:hypothetical protein N7513_003220 [Penicillium glabrum]
MLAYIQNEKDVDATRQRVLDDAIVCTARIENLTLYDYHSLRYPTKKEDKDTTKKKILWLWLRCMPHRAFAGFEREWQQKGAHKPSVEARFWFSCARLSELREIARMEGFANELDPDGDYFSIKFKHRMASTCDVPPGRFGFNASRDGTLTTGQDTHQVFSRQTPSAENKILKTVIYWM